MSKATGIFKVLENMDTIVKPQGITGGVLYVEINGQIFGYKSKELPLITILNTIRSMAKFSPEKVTSYLNSNAIMVSGD